MEQKQDSYEAKTLFFLDKKRSNKDSERPTIISLGRLIKHGMKRIWSKDKAFLLLPSKKQIELPIHNNCPYANEKVLEIVRKLRTREIKRLKVRDHYSNLFNALKLRLRSQKELDEHRRQGHPRYSPSQIVSGPLF